MTSTNTTTTVIVRCGTKLGRRDMTTTERNCFATEVSNAIEASGATITDNTRMSTADGNVLLWFAEGADWCSLRSALSQVAETWFSDCISIYAIASIQPVVSDDAPFILSEWSAA